MSALRVGALCLVVMLTIAAWPGAAPVSADVPAPIQFTRFASANSFAAGSTSGTLLDGDRLVLAPGEVSGTWTSAVLQAGVGFTPLVASRDADTPADSRLRVPTPAITAAGGASGGDT